MPQRRLNHNAYRVGWICPLEIEQIAAMEMLDEEHQRLPQSNGDTNIYNLGSINNHNIAIAGLPRAGNCSAATVVTQMRMTFPHIQYVMLVGIGGGVPVKTKFGRVRLGHVVVSQPTGIHSGAIKYDYGKAQKGLFERTGCLAPPPTILQNAIREVSIECDRSDYNPIRKNIKRIRTNRLALCRFEFPGIENDHLYQPEYTHEKAGLSCEDGGCDQTQRIDQPRDPGDNKHLIVIHPGTIASGDSVIKNAELRDALAEEHGVLCFEMEAAGALNDFPCIVIRGISDYCDSHKNDIWQGYAAAVAAAYARQIFSHISTIEQKVDPDLITRATHPNFPHHLRQVIPSFVEGLFCAVKGGRPSSVEEFIQAVKDCKIEIVKQLLERVDVNVRDPRSGRTALSFAAEAGYTAIAKILLDHGSLLNVRQYTRPGDDSVVNSTWTGGRSELGWAVCKRHAEMTQLLLYHGSDPNAANSAGRTPLHHACMNEDVLIVKILLENGADVNHRSYHSGWTPIHQTLLEGSEDVLKVLLEYNSLLDVHTTREKQTPLHMAVFKKSCTLLGLLLDKGANPNLGMVENLTPLHIAATLGWADGINILATSNATIDCQDYFLLETPPHKAARNCNHDACVILIGYGALVQKRNIDDQDYQSILSLARQYPEDWRVDTKKGYFLQTC